MEGFQEFIEIAPWTLFFTWANLLILYLLVKKFLFKPVQKIIAERENEVKASFDEAEQAKKSAESMKAEYSVRLSEAKNEASDLLKDATRRATLKTEEIMREASEKTQLLKQKAELQIEQEKKKAFGELKGEISEIAVVLASKVIEKEINLKDHERLIASFISDVGEVSGKTK